MNKKIIQICRIGIVALMCSTLFFAAKSSASWTGNVISASLGNLTMTGCYYTDLYLYHDYDNDTLADFGLYLNTNLMAVGQVNNGFEAWKISQLNSSVIVQAPLSGMIYKIFSGVNGDGTISPIDNNTFWRASFAMPYNTPVRLFATVPNLITFERPSDGDVAKNMVSIQYNYAYRYAVDVDASQNGAYRYNLIPDINYYGNAQAVLINNLGGMYGNALRTWSSNLTTNSSCRNMDLHRCGDGYIDGTTGRVDSAGAFTPVLFYDTGFTAETCDDGVNNGQAGYCPVNCGAGGLCGNGIVDEGEECDAGPLNGSDLCALECVFPVIDQAVDEAVNE